MISFKKSNRRAHRWSENMARNTPEEVNRLCAEHWPLVKWFAYHYGCRRGWDAAMSAAVDGLLRAAQTFDSGRGATFASHAVANMRGFLSHEVTRAMALKRGSRFEHVGLEDSSAVTSFVYPEFWP